MNYLSRQATQTKERPIVFNVETVKGILTGERTMVRRVVKFKDHLTEDITRLHIEKKDGDWWLFNEPNGWMIGKPKCPYGGIGERLWVRETWQQVSDQNYLTYKASYPNDLLEKMPYLENVPSMEQLKEKGYYWNSPVSMPKQFSRLLLEITDTRIERLQDISHQDYEKEGLWSTHKHNYKQEFSKHWDSFYELNSGRRWDNNPWVWCINFRVIERRSVLSK